MFINIKCGDHKEIVFIGNIYILLSLIYILDQKINYIFNVNGCGFIIIILILIIGNKFYIKRNDFIFIFIFIFYAISSFTLSPCEITYKFIFTIISFPFLYFLLIRGQLNEIVENLYISKFILLSVSLSLIISAILDKFFELDRIARFYYEYSHVALYMAPIIIYRLLSNYKDRIAWFAVAVISIYSFSTTFFIGIILTSIIIIKIYDLKKYSIIILFPLIAFCFFYADHIMDRVTGLFHSTTTADTNLSSLVWLNGFSTAYDYLKITDWLGVGLNMMGCNGPGGIGDYSSLIAIGNNGIVLNYEDGSFAASKIVSELGLFGLFIVGALTLYSLILIARSLKSRPHSGINFLSLAGAISTLICLYVRSAGYYQLHFILALSLLLGQRRGLKF